MPERREIALTTPNEALIADKELLNSLIDCYELTETQPLGTDFTRVVINDAKDGSGPYINGIHTVVRSKTNTVDLLGGTIIRNADKFVPPADVLQAERKAGISTQSRSYWQLLAKEILREAEARSFRDIDEKIEVNEITAATDVARAVLKVRTARTEEERNQAEEDRENLMKAKKEKNPYEYALLANHDGTGPVRFSGPLAALRRLVPEPLQNIQLVPVEGRGSNDTLLHYQIFTSHPEILNGKITQDDIEEAVETLLVETKDRLRRAVSTVLTDKKFMHPLLVRTRMMAGLNEGIVKETRGAAEGRSLDRMVDPKEISRFLQLMTSVAKLLGHDETEVLINELAPKDRPFGGIATRYLEGEKGRRPVIEIAYPEEETGPQGLRRRMEALADALALHRLRKAEQDDPEGGLTHNTLAEAYRERLKDVKIKTVTQPQLGGVQLEVVYEPPVSKTQESSPEIVLLEALEEDLANVADTVRRVEEAQKALPAAPKAGTALDVQAGEPQGWERFTDAVERGLSKVFKRATKDLEAAVFEAAEEGAASGVETALKEAQKPKGKL